MCSLTSAPVMASYAQLLEALRMPDQAIGTSVTAATGPRRRDLPAVRDLPPGYFALVMASGICSTALLDTGHAGLSRVPLTVALVAFVVLCVAVVLRAVRYPARLRADLAAPAIAYTFFTFVAACNVLAVRLTLGGFHVVAVTLALLSAVAWFALSYTIPVTLIITPRRQPVLAGVNGTWFIWVVGTQSLALSAAALDAHGGGAARLTALAVVLLWSVGVVLYLIVATLVLVRLLLLEVRPQDLTPPYWVTMGATAITVLAASRMLHMTPAPAVDAARPVVTGLAVVLWAFGTWLIPLLVVFGVWRHLVRRVPLGYQPALWSMVFPLGMYATASMDLGTVVPLPLVAGIGRAWTWVALVVWTLVFAAMCHTLLRPATRKLLSRTR